MKLNKKINIRSIHYHLFLLEVKINRIQEVRFDKMYLPAFSRYL